MKWFKQKPKEKAVDWEAEAKLWKTEALRMEKALASFSTLDEVNIQLIRQLRQMDQWAFSISQVAPDWKRIQPIFAEMMQHVDIRMQHENGRIRNLMVGEIKQAYNEPKTIIGSRTGRITRHDPPLKEIEKK